MANYGTKITLSLPTGGQVSWDGPLNDVLNAIIDVLADRVTPAGFNYSTDLDAQGHALIDVRDIAFAPSADTGAVNTIFVAGSGQAGVTAGEWYLRDSSNNLVQLTSGGTINVASNAGFGGGYAAASQAAGSPIATYNSANGRFSFTTDGSTPAEISAGALTGTQLDVNGGLAQFSGLTTLTGPVHVAGPMALSGTSSAYTTGSVTLVGALRVEGGFLTGSAVQQVKWDVPGRLVNRQVFVADGIYTPGVGVTSIVLRMVGGGGGGGGVPSPPGTCAGGGGSSGVFMEWYITPVSSTGSVYVGAAGAGGTAGSPGGDGGTGGDTKFVMNINGVAGTILLAKGGPGGKGDSTRLAGAIGTAAGGGSSLVGSTSGDFHLQELGSPSLIDGTVAVSGRGGSNPLGGGGVGVPVYTSSAVSTAGNAGNGWD